MTIQQIAKKYNVSENFLNSKDDALVVVAESITEIQTELRKTTPNQSVSDKLNKLVEFCVDIKRSTI
jgi:hypothetical protein